MDRLLSMRTFVQVVDDGGFAAAARTLDMSPAVVTRLIGDLEAHLNARLLQRTTRRIALTDAGEAYLGRVRAILSDVAEADALAQAQTREMSGVIRVLAPSTVAVNLLAPVAREFRRLHPKLMLDVHVEVNVEPLVEDYDLTLLVTDVAFDANLIARKIVETDIVPCASPAYLERHGTPRSPGDLTTHQRLQMNSASHGRPRPWSLTRAADGGNPLEIPAPVVLTSNHLEVLLRATLEGAGIGSLSIHLIAPYLRRGELQQLLPGWRSGSASIYAALPSRKFVPARTRALLDFLTASAEQMLAAVSDAATAPD